MHDQIKVNLLSINVALLTYFSGYVLHILLLNQACVGMSFQRAVFCSFWRLLEIVQGLENPGSGFGTGKSWNIELKVFVCKMHQSKVCWLSICVGSDASIDYF